MVFKKIIFQKSLMANETPPRPPPLHGKCHLKFPFWLFDYLPYWEPLLYAMFETKEARASTVFLLNGCFDIPFLIQICREGADWQLLSQRVLLAVDMTRQTFSNNTFPFLANVTFAMLGLPCCRSEQNCQSCNMPDLSVLLKFLKYMFSSSWMETKTTDFNVNEI